MLGEQHPPLRKVEEYRSNRVPSRDSKALVRGCSPAGKPLRSQWRAFTQQRSQVSKPKTIIASG
jgi:hypothetical protein